MQELSVKLGADIPYCIMGGTALSEGIGEVLTPLPAPPHAYILIAKPNISVSTKFVYENLHADTLQKHPDIDGRGDPERRSPRNYRSYGKRTGNRYRKDLSCHFGA